MEREITEAVDLCLPSGRLNPAAVGWSRRPLHRANLKGWGRNKRFEYWAIATPGIVATLNISNHDYRVNIATSVVDLATFTEVAQRENRWLPRGYPLPETPGGGAAEAKGGSVWVRLAPEQGGTWLRAESRRISVDVHVVEEPGHESMGVVVPWTSRRFQYTRKDNCLRAHGRVVLDGVEHPVETGSSYVTHDHGRGRWPYLTLWNWGSGSGTSDGHEIGLQFGGKWTDGTPSTENAIRIDGRLHKISAHLTWRYDRTDWMAPWTIRGDRVDLTFDPVSHHHSRFNRWVVMHRGNSCFGHFRGDVVDDFGDRHHLSGIFGHVEEVRRRW